MRVVGLERSLRQLHMSRWPMSSKARLRQAEAEAMAPIDLVACLVSDELTRRADRLLQRRRKQARLRDPDKTLDNFDFRFNPKMNRGLVFDLATGAFIAKTRRRFVPGSRRDRQKPLGPSYRASRHSGGLLSAILRGSRPFG